jgi:hypothetical protein
MIKMKFTKEQINALNELIESEDENALNEFLSSVFIPVYTFECAYCGSIGEYEHSEVLESYEHSLHSVLVAHSHDCPIIDIELKLAVIDLQKTIDTLKDRLTQSLTKIQRLTIQEELADTMAELNELTQ